MIKAICGKCKHVFMAAVVMCETVKCPKCGSSEIYTAVEK